MKTKLESLIEEAKIQAEEHPSKDARWFANSVHEYLTQRQWVGLTDEEVEMIVENKRADPSEQVRYVEAKLKQKNYQKGQTD